MRRVDAVKPRVSFADLQRMPDDGNRYELYDGELRVVPSPLPWHQIVVERLHEILIDFRRQRGVFVFHAPFDIVLSDFNVVQPDILYFSAASARRINMHEHVRFPPDLAIEVLSPSTAKWDRGPKRDLFARFGLPECWIVDPQKKQIEISVSAKSYSDPVIVMSGQLVSPTIDGLSFDIEPVFAEVG
jgi:Uma2 family endonuclease